MTVLLRTNTTVKLKTGTMSVDITFRKEAPVSAVVTGLIEYVRTDTELNELQKALDLHRIRLNKAKDNG